MELRIEDLRDRISDSVYNLLTTDDYMSLPTPDEADIDCAHSVIIPYDIPYSWVPVLEINLEKKERVRIRKCTVVSSEYGLSMKFEFIKGKGNTYYIPCGNYPAFKEGQEWYPRDLKIVELRKYGEDGSIYRVAPADQYIEIASFPNKSYCDEYTYRTDVFWKILSRYQDLLKRDGKKVNIFKYLRLY